MMRVFGLLLAVLAAIAGFWFWLGKPVAMPPHSAMLGEPLHCVSFAPFRAHQTPFDKSTQVSAEQVEEDMTRIRKITDCVRTYAVDMGGQHVPAIARKLGMKIYLGIWIGRKEMDNRVQIETALSLANRYPDVVRAIIVGNEVLLRREQSPADMARLISEVKSRTKVPVTYADVWEFWLQNPDLAKHVDFITIHTLPYWEDIPIAVEKSAAHIDETLKHVKEKFPGREILIGEVGWPSAGRMREGALPSLSNQARLLADVTRAAREGGYKFNWIEVIDQPWKRRSEGTVGGYWGIFEAGAESPKYLPGAPVSDHPHWKMQAVGGMALALGIFALGFATARRQGLAPSLTAWMAVAAVALVAGALSGMMLEKLVLESLNAGEWLFGTLRAATMLAAALYGTVAIIAGLPAPGLPRAEAGKLLTALRHAHLPELLFLGVIFFTLQAAIGLTFEPRYRDFPTPTLTIGLLPLLLAGMLQPGVKADGIQKGLAIGLGLALVWITYNEGLANWQALWFVATLAVASWLLLSFPRAQRQA